MYLSRMRVKQDPDLVSYIKLSDTSHVFFISYTAGSIFSVVLDGEMVGRNQLCTTKKRTKKNTRIDESLYFSLYDIIEYCIRSEEDILENVRMNG